MVSCAVQASERQSTYLCLTNIVVVGLRRSHGEKENSAEETFGVHDDEIDRLLD